MHKNMILFPKIKDLPLGDVACHNMKTKFAGNSKRFFLN